MSIKPAWIQSRAFTLLEVLVTIVVLAIAATAIINVFVSTVRSSADPLIQQQAIAIANAYLEEIEGQHFADPVQPETGGAEAGETRATYDDVQDYHGLSDAGAKSQSGFAITGLGDFQVDVSIAAATLAGITAASGNALRIDVTVSHAAIAPILISGYRVNY